MNGSAAGLLRLICGGGVDLGGLGLEAEVSWLLTGLLVLAGGESLLIGGRRLIGEALGAAVAGPAVGVDVEARGGCEAAVAGRVVAVVVAVRT